MARSNKDILNKYPKAARMRHAFLVRWHFTSSFNCASSLTCLSVLLQRMQAVHYYAFPDTYHSKVTKNLWAVIDMQLERLGFGVPIATQRPDHECRRYA